MNRTLSFTHSQFFNSRITTHKFTIAKKKNNGYYFCILFSVATIYTDGHQLIL